MLCRSATQQRFAQAGVYYAFPEMSWLVVKKEGSLEVGVGDTKLTVTVTVVECDIVPLFPVMVTV